MKKYRSRELLVSKKSLDKCANSSSPHVYIHEVGDKADDFQRLYMILAA